MIIDFHSHYSMGIEKIKTHLEKNKISKVVLFPIAGPDPVDESVKILNLSKKYSFIIPFLRFDPNNITKKRLEGLLELGFKGVKLHPRVQNFNPVDMKINWIFEIIKKYNIPIIFHCKSYYFDKNSHPEKLLKLAKRHPNQIFVFGHFAGVNKDLFKEFAKFENIYVETSIDVTPNAYREVIFKHKFERLIFGTDFPYSFGEIELLKLKMAKLPEKMNNKILYENAQTVLNL